MPVLLDSLFGIHERSLLLRSQRATILASNLANVDTPNYKARDFDFKSILQNENNTSVRMYSTQRHPQHLPIDSNNQYKAVSSDDIQYRNPHQASLDGNTVENDIEQSRFAENAVRYQASLQFATGKSRSIIKALRGE